MDSHITLPYPCRITVVKENGKEGKSYEFLEKRSWCIMGKHEDCDIRIQASGVASLHALIQVKPEGVIIQGLDRKYPIDFPRLNKSIFIGQPATIENDEIFFLGPRKFRISYEPIQLPVTPSNSATSLPGIESVPTAVSSGSKGTPDKKTRNSRRRRSSLVVTGSEETFVTSSSDPTKLLQRLPPSTSSSSVDLTKPTGSLPSPVAEFKNDQPLMEPPSNTQASMAAESKTSNSATMSAGSSTLNAFKKPATVPSSNSSPSQVGKSKRSKPPMQGPSVSVPRTPQTRTRQPKDVSVVTGAMRQRTTATPRAQRKLPFTTAGDSQPELSSPTVSRSPQASSSLILRGASQEVKASDSHDEDALPSDQSFDNLSIKERFELKYARLSRGLSATPRRGEPLLPESDERALKIQTPSALKSVRHISTEDEGLKSLASPSQPLTPSKEDKEEGEKDSLDQGLPSGVTVVQALQSRLETVQISLPGVDEADSKYVHETVSEEHETVSEEHFQDVSEQGCPSTELPDHHDNQAFSANKGAILNETLRELEASSPSEVMDNQDNEVSIDGPSPADVGANGLVQLKDGNTQICQPMATASSKVVDTGDISIEENASPLPGIAPNPSSAEALESNLGHTNVIEMSSPQSVETSMEVSQQEPKNQGAIIVPDSEVTDTTCFKLESGAPNTNEADSSISPNTTFNDATADDINANKVEAPEQDANIKNASEPQSTQLSQSEANVVIVDSEMSNIERSQLETDIVHTSEPQKTSSLDCQLGTAVDTGSDGESTVTASGSALTDKVNAEKSIALGPKAEGFVESVEMIRCLSKNSEVASASGSTKVEIDTKVCAEDEKRDISSLEGNDCQTTIEDLVETNSKQGVPGEPHSPGHKSLSLSSRINNEKPEISSPAVPKAVESVSGTQNDSKGNTNLADVTNSDCLEDNENDDLVASMNIDQGSVPSVFPPETNVRGKDTTSKDTREEDNVVVGALTTPSIPEPPVNSSDKYKDIPESVPSHNDVESENENGEKEQKDCADVDSVSGEVLVNEKVNEHEMVDQGGGLGVIISGDVADVCATSVRVDASEVASTEVENRAGNCLDQTDFTKNSEDLENHPHAPDGPEGASLRVSDVVKDNEEMEELDRFVNKVDELGLDEKANVFVERSDSFTDKPSTEQKEKETVNVSSKDDLVTDSNLPTDNNLMETAEGVEVGGNSFKDGANVADITSDSHSDAMHEDGDGHVSTSLASIGDLNLERMKVKELQSILRKCGLSASGKKRDLIARLSNHIALTKESPSINVGSDVDVSAINKKCKEFGKTDSTNTGKENIPEAHTEKIEEQPVEVLEKESGNEQVEKVAENIAEKDCDFEERDEAVSEEPPQEPERDFVCDPMKEVAREPLGNAPEAEEDRLEKGLKSCASDKAGTDVVNFEVDVSGESVVNATDDRSVGNVEEQSTNFGSKDFPGTPRRDEVEFQEDLAGSGAELEDSNRELLPSAVELSKMRVKDLQTLLKHRSMSVSGRKQELIARLLGVEAPSHGELCEMAVECTPTPKTPRSTRKMARTPSIAMSATRRSARISRRVQTAENMDSSATSSDSEEPDNYIDSIPLQELDENAEANDQKRDGDKAHDSCDSMVESKVREFRKKTVKELRKLLVEREVDAPLKARKDDLIERLVALTLDDGANSEADAMESSDTEKYCEDKALSQLTVKDLRSRLDDLGLCFAGTKSSLVQRLQTALDGSAHRTRRAAIVDEPICSACKDGHDCEAS